jgi:hypothetical protein
MAIGFLSNSYERSAPKETKLNHQFNLYFYTRVRLDYLCLFRLSAPESVFDLPGGAQYDKDARFVRRPTEFHL